MPHETYHPVSRVYLQTLKQQIADEQRKKDIHSIVGFIYGGVLKSAKQSTETWFVWQIPDSPVNKELFVQNKDEILGKLKDLFPDCSVSYTTVCFGMDGKMYDAAKLDPKMMVFMNKNMKNKEAIVVDWS
jgi:hypothetical protein